MKKRNGNKTVKAFCFCLIMVIIFFAACKNKSDSQSSKKCYDGNFIQPVKRISFKNDDQIKLLQGQFVEMEGYFSYSFEDVALYSSKFGETNEALWINFLIPNKFPDTLLNSLHNKRVSLIGKINLKSKGHLGAYIGSLDSVFCIKGL